MECKLQFLILIHHVHSKAVYVVVHNTCSLYCIYPFCVILEVRLVCK